MDLQQFIETLFEPADIVNIRALRKSQGANDIEQKWLPASSIAGEYEKLKEQNKNGFDLYAGVMPRTQEGGGSADFVLGGRVLWLDFDHTRELPEAIKDLPEPTMTIDSGHGIHVYWKLDTFTDKAIITNVLKGLVWTGSDRACTDAARIMRIPGFTNMKEPVAECKIRTHTGKVYPISAFTPFLRHAGESKRLQVDVIPAPVKMPVQNSIDSDIAEAKAAKYVNKMPGSGEGGRNDALYRVGAVLKEFRLTKEQRMRIGLEWNEKKNVPPLDEDEARRTIINAYNHAQNPEGCMHIPAARPKQRYIHPDELDESVYEYPVGYKEELARMEAEELAAAGAGEDGQEEPPPEAGKKPAFPLECLDVPGFINDFQEYALAQMPVKNKISAFAAALSLQAMFIGRRANLHLEDDTHSNCYITLLAESGTGKDKPRKIIKNILTAADKKLGLANENKHLLKHIGDKFASGQAIITSLEDADGNKLYLYDEIDKLVTNIADKRSVWANTLQQELMTLYSSATSTYIPADRADKSNNQKPLVEPNVCLYGTGTPKVFFENFTEDSLTNGFIGRLIVFEGDDNPERVSVRDRVKKHADNDDGDTSKFDAMAETAIAWLTHEGNVDFAFPRIGIQVTDEAIAMIDQCNVYAWEQILEARKNTTGGSAQATIWNRYAENRNKLLMLYATSKSGPYIKNAVVDAGAVTWADKLARYSCKLMCYAAGTYMGANQFDIEGKRIIKHLVELCKKSGVKAVSRTKLFRKCGKIDLARDKIIDALEDQGLIRQYETDVPSKNGKLVKMVECLVPMA